MTNNNIKNIVVTGCSGFIGSRLVEELLLNDNINRVVGVVRDDIGSEKYGFLKELKGAKGKLELVSGDLENADYDSIFKGMDAVLHIASPYFHQADNVEKEIVKPAIDGNIRVLSAASKKSSIKKVIITSSAGAIVDIEKKKQTYDDNDWNDSCTISRPYVYSKYHAEKAVWDYKKNNNVQYEIIVIAPVLVIGPPVNGNTNLNTSLKAIKSLLTGQGDSVVNRCVGIVDVRDVVKVHIKALLSNENYDNARCLVVQTNTTYQEMGGIIKSLYPQYSITLHLVNQSHPYHEYKCISNSLLKLNDLEFIDFKTTLKDTVDFLINNNHFKPSLKK